MSRCKFAKSAASTDGAIMVFFIFLKLKNSGMEPEFYKV